MKKLFLKLINSCGLYTKYQILDEISDAFELNIIEISKNNFWKIKKLIEWHFDIAGLIDKNEAIDINTLQENPYK